jgi:hypothetical protein
VDRDRNSRLGTEERVRDLLGRMAPEGKAARLNCVVALAAWEWSTTGVTASALGRELATAPGVGMLYGVLRAWRRART